MADYVVVEGQEEVDDESKVLDRTEAVESKSRISVSDLKERYSNIQSEITRLTEDANKILAEIEAIALSEVVTVAEVPGAITMAIAAPAPPKIKL